MTLLEEEESLRAELAKHEAAIQDAYWRFTRTSSPHVPPPSTQVPEAYRRRREIKERLREIRRGRRVERNAPQATPNDDRLDAILEAWVRAHEGRQTFYVSESGDDWVTAPSMPPVRLDPTIRFYAVTSDGRVYARVGRVHESLIGRIRDGQLELVERVENREPHSYCFVGACPQLTGPLINYLREHERDVSYLTLARWVSREDLQEFKDAVGYGRETGLYMATDYGISYQRSRLPSGARAYFFVWSAMEYVFVPCELRFNLEEETELAIAAGFR